MFDERVSRIFEEFGVKPFDCKYLAVYHTLDRLGIIKRKQIKVRKWELVVRFLGGFDEARRIINELYNEVKPNGCLKNIKDVTRDLNKLLAEHNLRISERITKELMKKLGIETRFHGERRQVIPFTGSKLEMLYIWGFCIGDASIRKLRGGRIKLDVSGKKETLEAIYSILRKYLPKDVKIGKRADGYDRLNISLDKSFSFLLKPIETILKEIKTIEEMSALLAGLIDSEGHIRYEEVKYIDRRYNIVRRKKSRVITIANKDINLLERIQEKLAEFNISAFISGPDRNNVYTLGIAKKDSLEQLAPILFKHLKHKEKKKRLKEILKEISEEEKAAAGTGKGRGQN